MANGYGAISGWDSTIIGMPTLHEYEIFVWVLTLCWSTLFQKMMKFLTGYKKIRRSQRWLTLPKSTALSL